MSEQITLIPGRLKSAAVNGYVTGTEDIIDDILNKTQQQLNLYFNNLFNQQQQLNSSFNNLFNQQIKHIFLTQDQYDSLTDIQKNALYFIIPEETDSSDGWHFGDSFPIKFSNTKWHFGNTFPIKF